MCFSPVTVINDASVFSFQRLNLQLKLIDLLFSTLSRLPFPLDTLLPMLFFLPTKQILEVLNLADKVDGCSLHGLREIRVIKVLTEPAIFILQHLQLNVLYLEIAFCLD